MKDKISNWIKEYASTNNRKSLVVGISGGIDSSVVSTLCAKTGLPTYAISMPIRQIKSQNNLSIDHGSWLTNKFPNVIHHIINLDNVFFKFDLLMKGFRFNSDHANANTKSRLRMVTLHQISSVKQGIVVGTGNKIEDFGVGFFTKYGDGGVDISPIADFYKTEIWQMGKELGILQEIIDAPPTDGLWEDGRTDQDQLGGLTYKQMEDAMKLEDKIDITEEEKDLLNKYRSIREPNLHKMKEIPVFKNDSRTQTSDSKSRS